MSLLDNLLKNAKSTLQSEAKRAVTKVVNKAAFDVKNKIAAGANKKEKFVFTSLPTSVEELKALPEATLDSPFKTAALTVAVLCNYKNDPATMFAMLDVLKGPAPMMPQEKNFITERLRDEPHKPFSFFEGSSPDNDYVPSEPYTITVMANPYSFDNENWATLFVKTSGADSERKIVFRKKPSTNQWFLNDIQCLSDIRTPKSQNPWA